MHVEPGRNKGLPGQRAGLFCVQQFCRHKLNSAETADSYQKLQILTKNCRFLPKTFVQEFWQGAPPGLLPLSGKLGKEAPPACSLCPGLLARKVLPSSLLPLSSKNAMKFYVCKVLDPANPANPAKMLCCKNSMFAKCWIQQKCYVAKILCLQIAGTAKCRNC